MDLVWRGMGCFSLTERGFPSVVTDPYSPEDVGLSLRGLRADLVTSSALVEEPQHLRWSQIQGVIRTIASPGEYEIGGTFITGVATTLARPEQGGTRENIAYTVSHGDTVVCHLGELSHAPTQAQVEAIGPVTVLLVPVGIPGGLTPGMASETVSLIEPAIVVPMQYAVPGLSVSRRPLGGFLKELGVLEPDPLPSLRISNGTEPEEMQVVVLAPQ